MEKLYSKLLESFYQKALFKTFVKLHPKTLFKAFLNNNYF